MKEEELSDRMDRLSESLSHGHSKKSGEFCGKNDEDLEGGANL